MPLLKILVAVKNGRTEEVGSMLATAACSSPLAVGMTWLALLVTLARIEAMGAEDVAKATLIPLKALFKAEFGMAKGACEEVIANDNGFNPELGRLRLVTIEKGGEVDRDSRKGVFACGIRPEKVKTVAFKALEKLYKPGCSAPPAAELVCTGNAGMSAACAAGRASSRQKNDMAVVRMDIQNIMEKAAFFISMIRRMPGMGDCVSSSARDSTEEDASKERGS